MTRHLRIHCTVDEAVAGTILADLAGRVSNLDFEVVEHIPDTQNKPREAQASTNGYRSPPSRMSHSGKRSVIPKLFEQPLAKLRAKGEPLTSEQAKKLLSENGLSPMSYSHALVLLQKANQIHATPKRGVYEVL